MAEGSGGMGFGLSGSGTEMGVGIYNIVSGWHKTHQSQKQLNGLMGNRPRYNVWSQYYDNLDLAQKNTKMYSDLTKTNQMPGQQYAEDNLSQNTANTLGQAQMYGTDNPAILAQLAQNAVQTQNQGSRDLSMEGAQLRQQNYGNLAGARDEQAGANTALAEEKDKAWNYNTNMPYQLKVQMARDRIKTGQEQTAAGTDQLGSSSSSSASFV